MIKQILFFFCLAVPLLAQELGVRKYLIPQENQQVESRDFLQALLKAGGSQVLLPEDFPSQRISLNKPGSRILLFSWNQALKGYGVLLVAEKDQLILQVDLNQFEAKLDSFEKTFIEIFDVEREAELIHLSAEESTGPVVVLVHGLDSSKRLFGGSCDFLVQAGYDVYFFEYPNDDRVERNAERFSEALKSLPAERRQDISLITVSMGGVISRLMIETPELHVEGVKRFIACVPPFQGSEMADLRGIVEVGDHAMSVIFDPEKALDFWGDGMGRAGVDLQPRSLLMEKMARLQRNPQVQYSILAGNKGIFDPVLLQKARDSLTEEAPRNAVLEAARLMTLERMDLILKFQSPHGDGVVTLDSATLEGVEDRVVLPYSHLDFLTGFNASDQIPALKEVLARLPEP